MRQRRKPVWRAQADRPAAPLCALLHHLPARCLPPLMRPQPAAPLLPTHSGCPSTAPPTTCCWGWWWRRRWHALRGLRWVGALVVVVGSQCVKRRVGWKEGAEGEGSGKRWCQFQARRQSEKQRQQQLQHSQRQQQKHGRGKGRLHQVQWPAACWCVSRTRNVLCLGLNAVLPHANGLVVCERKRCRGCSAVVRVCGLGEGAKRVAARQAGRQASLRQSR